MQAAQPSGTARGTYSPDLSLPFSGRDGEPAKSYVLWTRDGRNGALGWHWGFPRVEFHKIQSQGGDLKPVGGSRRDARAGNVRESKGTGALRELLMAPGSPRAERTP